MLQSLLSGGFLAIVTPYAVLYDVVDCIYSQGLRLFVSRMFRRRLKPAKSAHEAAEAEGFHLKDHTVQTSDGYILTLHRLVSSTVPFRGPVLLQHGLYQSSMLFLINKRQDALAYILSDLGYDVWLGNNRGNIHSRQHAQYRSDEPAFWDWGVDELALDVQANVEYIAARTNQPIFYVGHSQGATQGLIAFSLNEKLQQKVAAFIALSPGACVVSALPCYPLQFLEYLAQYPAFYHLVFGSKDFLPYIDTIRYSLPSTMFEYFSYVMFKYMFKWTDANWDLSRKSAFFSETPAGTSARTVAQWMQQPRARGFQMFCHGKEKNLELYGEPEAPEYPLEKIKIPTAVIYGGKDHLIECARLVEMLTNCVHSKRIDHHEHLDSVISRDAKQLVYPDILRVLNTHPTITKR